MHQWLEVTLRPSMTSYVVDLWYEGVWDYSEAIGMPI